MYVYQVYCIITFNIHDKDMKWYHHYHLINEEISNRFRVTKQFTKITWFVAEQRSDLICIPLTLSLYFFLFSRWLPVKNC